MSSGRSTGALSGRTPGSVPRQGDYKFIEDGGLMFLYNVRTDPEERRDLAAATRLVSGRCKCWSRRGRRTWTRRRTGRERSSDGLKPMPSLAQRVQAPLAGAGCGEIEEDETEDYGRSPPLATGQNPRGRCAWK